MKTRPALRRLPPFLALGVLLGGCAAPASRPPPPAAAAVEPELMLHPGDTLRLAFAAAPNLDTTQQIRRDGRLNLPMVGEVRAADRSPAELQAELRQAYSRQLVSSDLTVTVVSSSFTVFVTGAVLRPGKVTPERAITALEAVMEAGGFDPARADSRAVVVIRTGRHRTQNIVLDLKAVLEGRQPTPYYLQPYDIVYVPEKFSFF